MTDRSWAHRPEFDPAAMEEFEARLGRARSSGRAQYLRVKAAVLLEHAEPAALPIAIGLLKRVVDEYDDFLQVPFSHELLGGAYRCSGDLAQAETHLKLAIETADESRNGLSLPELELAEVMIEAGRHEDAATQLQAAERLEPGMVWNSQLYRHAVARARVENQTGGNPAPWAQRALELSADTQPQLSRHPTVGLVRTRPDQLREMRRLAAGRAKRPWRRA